MINFADWPDYKRYEKIVLPYLLGAVRRFFGCVVRFDSRPIVGVKMHHGIDILENVNRGVYVVDDGKAVILLGRILQEKEVKAAFSLTLTGSYFSGLEKLLNNFEAALALTLSSAAIKKLVVKPQQFGDDLVELAIAKHFGKGSFDHRYIQYLIRLFSQLSTTQFEGRGFTTGLVLTRSLHAFSKKSDQERQGDLYPLVGGSTLSPINQLDKRFWYLADGQTSFFVANKQLKISNLFVVDSSRQSLGSFVDDYTLSKTIKGSDVLFRVTSQSEFSIVGSEGVEFNYKENGWRVRDLNKIAEVIRVTLGVDEPFVQSLLYYILYLSRRRLSSIIWIPIDMDSVNSLLLSDNSFTRKPLSIMSERHTQTLLRILSSDGASVFTRQGDLVSYGSHIDISKKPVKGVKGTGETVAALLAENGLAIKISQDGRIKMFSDSIAGPLVI
ncbi:hypothetical protein SAMN02745900_04831 [Pseudomonas sp. URIL14HWK12:I8]|uniref:hypothetical protein n=1 Tax=unclassified Pseudomonas TaxID=196821 RepID=UPI000406EAAF|nr:MULTISPECIES: hypothetical protein [unclassified Pseudomonas]MDE4540631.1 hypothetical protein [Pseudomonas sp. ITEM 17296]SNB85899.1 hypothetical protein SAMN02745900_04831 [Pseudomonas sp. URIL14HWK12:I8]